MSLPQDLVTNLKEIATGQEPSEVPAGTPLHQMTTMSPRGRAALMAAGIETIEEAQSWPDDRLLMLSGFKNASLEKLRAWRPRSVVSNPAKANTVNTREEVAEANPDADLVFGYPEPTPAERREIDLRNLRCSTINLAQEVIQSYYRDLKKTGHGPVGESFKAAAIFYETSKNFIEWVYGGCDGPNPMFSAIQPQVKKNSLSRIDLQVPASVPPPIPGAPPRRTPPPPVATIGGGQRRRSMLDLPDQARGARPAPAANPDDNNDWDDSHLGSFEDQDY